MKEINIVYNLAKVFKNKRPDQNYDDLVFDGMYGLAIGLSRLNIDKSRKSYLERIIKGNIQDGIRDRDRQNKIWSRLACRTKTEYTYDDFNDLIIDAIKDPKQKQIMEAYLFEGNGVSAAMALGISESQVSNSIKKSIQEVKKYWGS